MKKALTVDLSNISSILRFEGDDFYFLNQLLSSLWRSVCGDGELYDKDFVSSYGALLRRNLKSPIDHRRITFAAQLASNDDHLLSNFAHLSGKRHTRASLTLPFLRKLKELRTLLDLLP